MPSLEDSPGFFAAARVELGRKDPKCQTAQALTASVRVFNNPVVQRRSYAESQFVGPRGRSRARRRTLGGFLSRYSRPASERPEPERRGFHDRPGPRGGTSRIASCARPQRRGRRSPASAKLLPPSDAQKRQRILQKLRR